MITIFNNYLITAKFRNELKLAGVTPNIDMLVSFFSTFLCGYRKDFSTQQALLLLIEIWKNILDQNGYSGGILMDLSKAFDTINHDLLIAKLGAYYFDTESLKLSKSYLANSLQRTKVNTSFGRLVKIAFRST